MGQEPIEISLGKEKVKILFYEPFYGGSHQFFADQWEKRSEHLVQLVKGPSLSWKWAMRLSAMDFEAQLESVGGLSEFDLFVCSSLTNLSELKAVLPKELPVIVYNHENQFFYPVRKEDQRDFQFQILQMQNLMLADFNLFNSTWNLKSCLEGFRRSKRRIPSQFRRNFNEDWSNRTKVIPLGVEVREIQSFVTTQKNEVPVVVWNHRLEFDKGIEDFIQLFSNLKKQGVGFCLRILGDSSSQAEDVRSRLNKLFPVEILENSPIRDRNDYYSALAQSDIALSLASHEFFGLSVHEAVAAGCVCFLPNRLSYPEFFQEDDQVKIFDTLGELERGLKSSLTTKASFFPNQKALDIADQITELDTWLSHFHGTIQSK